MTASDPRGYLKHILLFVVTCVTTTYAGLLYVGPPVPDLWMGAQGLEPGGIDYSHWWRGLAFSGTLMGILLTHEMGHFITARRHGMDVSLPYFIPLPFGLGTLGAVIAMRERVRSRNALMDIGAAGPLSGLVVAIPLMVAGLMLSEVDSLPPGQLATTEGSSILYLILKLAVTGEILPSGSRDVFLHPVAWAAWCGLLVTMINLIPVGQLDGGHVGFAFFGDRYERASRWLHRILPILGLAVLGYVFFDSMGRVAAVPEGVPPLWLNTPVDAFFAGLTAAMPWLFWSLFLLVLWRTSGRRYHAPVDLEPLSDSRRTLGIVVFIVFLLIFTPIPLRVG